MRKYLLPETGNFYKANLHCHTTMSDGQKTPEEIKELYMKKGYSIVAYTDHDVFILHNDLTDENFLAMNGFEVEVMDWYGRHPLRDCKVCHLCFVALDKNIEMHPLWHREKHVWGDALKVKHLVKFDDTLQNYSWTYSPECLTEMMEIGKKEGFFVTYNHPNWSKETYEQYSKYHGMHAMEILNGNCIATGYEDYNPRVYDDFLRLGEKIYCIGADDNHNDRPDDMRQCDSGWAWTTIKADKLDYETISDALLKGHFYASEGPEIYDLYVEDGKVHIKCSPADRVICTYEKRGAGAKFAEIGGEPVTEVAFDANPDYGYFRITVRDERGNVACTNAYFPEDYL